MKVDVVEMQGKITNQEQFDAFMNGASDFVRISRGDVILTELVVLIIKS